MLIASQPHPTWSVIYFSLDIPLQELQELIFCVQVLSFEDYHYVFPPVGKAIAAIKHLAKFESTGVLIIPIWARSPWFSWFFLMDDIAWVKTLLIFNPVFASGIGVGQVFKGVKPFDTAALEFDFQSFSLSYAEPFPLHLCWLL